MKPFTVGLALAIGAVIAACLVVQTWRGEQSFLPTNAVGSLHSVVLINNQVYYGRLDRLDRRSISISHVFYVQILSDEKTGARTNKLVERAKADWHGPAQMTIAIDKIMYIEAVGPDSQVAKLIREAEGSR